MMKSNLKELIKSVLEIEVTADNYKELKENPKAFTKSEEDTKKVEELILLIDMTHQIQQEEK